MKIKHRLLQNQGFTLVETLVGMIMFGSVVGATLPVMMAYTLKTIDNDVKLGAVAVSQQVMDELRQSNATSLPASGVKQVLPSGASTAAMVFKNKTYSIKITYCNNATLCDSTTRQIMVDAYHGSRPEPVFSLETVYTQIKDEA